jgi:hypothetical protein
MPRKKKLEPDSALNPRVTITSKLAPDRLRVSTKFHAILGCMLDQAWTTPRITALCILSDGHVLGEKEGDAGFNLFLGDESDLERNLRGVCKAVGATREEVAYLFNLLARFRA